MNEASIERSEIDKVIARVQKMLSRTKDGSGTTEAEADTALKMAQELMAKYNLDMAVIEAAQGPASTVVERVKEQVTSKAMYKWQRQLAKYVAEANFCYYLLKEDRSVTSGWWELNEEYRASPEAIGMELRITGEQRGALPDWDTKYMYSCVTDTRRKTTHSHVFVGRKANVITAQLMFQYLTQTIETLALVEMPDLHHLSRSVFSWKEGCSDRICGKPKPSASVKLADVAPRKNTSKIADGGHARAAPRPRARRVNTPSVITPRIARVLKKERASGSIFKSPSKAHNRRGSSDADRR